MSTKNKFTGVLIFGAAFTIRLILFQSSSITETLGSRVEIVTPVTSFTRRMYFSYLFIYLFEIN